MKTGTCRGATACLAAMLFLCANLVWADDHGDDAPGASVLNLDSSVNGHIEISGDVDWFRIHLNSSVSCVFQTELGSLSDSKLYLYDTDGVTELTDNDDYGGEFRSRIAYGFSAAGDYYLEVQGYGSNTGTYSLSASTLADDHGNSAAEASVITVGTRFDGTIEVINDRDYFQIALDAGKDYQLQLDASAGLEASKLSLYDTDGASLLHENVDDPLGGEGSRILFTCPTSGNYFLAAEAKADVNLGDYQIIVSEGFPVAFEDVSVATGISAIYAPNGPDNAVAWGDVNADGYMDLYLGSYDHVPGVYLFLNNGGATFSKAAITNVPMWWPGNFVDFDNDGDLDLYSAMAGGHLARQKANGDFEDATPLLETFSWQSECSAWGDFNGDSWLDFYRSGWEASASGPYYKDGLFISNNGQYFAKTWETLDGEERAGRGVTIADFDEDHDLDIYVSCYRITKNLLWINDGNGNFTDQAEAHNVDADEDECTGGYEGGHTIGSAWADMDNDGHLDLFVGNFSHSTACQDRPFFYKNLGPAGNWQFQLVDQLDGPDWVESSASPAFADFDNDGDLDLFLTAIAGYYSGQKCRLFENQGNFNFVDVSTDYGLSITTPDSNFQAAWGDYNNDGFLDLFTGRKLYKNPLSGNGNHWLKVKVVGNGEDVDTMGVGTQVRLTLDGGGSWMTRQVETATGWGNQNSPLLHFGLGSYSGPLSLKVTWLNGTVNRYQVSGVDQVVTVTGPREDPLPPAQAEWWTLY